ncbi:hypothetical protein SAMN04515671_3883 [Nakamurella panacisegetis]|uniref:Uncharacterized protein n=1 Tax=Nakamurella panacisegetis TaxID=1090615 RepID=A0A1H0S2S6_9ACTN|nr:hypothetical protein [Nakamurella panacisegetis]SDP36151.1 hypothetical protein SAMN04515671_3883 [Nakamurella panacisegetis]
MEENQLPWAEAMRDMAKQAALSPIFEEASALFGDRLTDSYFGGPDVVRLSVLNLEPADTAAIQAIARQLGIDEAAVQIERSDPAELEAWEQLRRELEELHLARPRVLQMSPQTEQRFCHPPWHIQLAADAEEFAKRLHHKYGNLVVLRVGALIYPMTAHSDEHNKNHRPATFADPHELRVALDGPLSIRRGQTAIHHVNVTNLSNVPLHVHTNGQITADGVDPVTGATVGGFCGAQRLALITFIAAPAGTIRIPLLVCTASIKPELGYMVPLGTWGLLAPLDLGDGRRLLSERMELTIVN